ncbi:putative oocyst wall protein [Gregarina niphandrodes]|uniref:Oocyst wall protein n=1 Tax=Gregarina niphandrodes TaxID=110365 RepID=A0A023B5M5_GRENI|nr:putative oocyst wall protein [Gregarina niphandrodes]EZG61143.1 putative oocyst wall protein [Gregarina niphandrodes]|eukprot:XP_011130796.1 putative oocyst wall protein [Gregarina niphandrodes]
MRSFVTLAFVGIAASQKSATTDPVYSCPAGFTLNGKTCRRQVSSPASLFCPVGVLENGQCIAPGQKDSHCPVGTTPVAGGCQSRSQTPAERVCPPNTHDIGGECQTYGVTGIVEVCQTGELINGECVTYEPVAQLKGKRCPAGYTEQKGSCYKTAQMDCTPPHQGKRLLQAKGAMPTHGKGTVNLAAPYLAAHLEPATAPKYVPTPAKLAVTQKQCEVKLEAAVNNEANCPAGTVAHHATGCATKHVEPSAVACSLGESYLCFPASPAPSTLRCPQGYNLLGDMCVKTTVSPRAVACAEGSILAPNGQCIQILGGPQPRCPPGQQVSGTMCLGSETVPPQVQVTVTCTGKDCYRH